MGGPPTREFSLLGLEQSLVLAPKPSLNQKTSQNHPRLMIRKRQTRESSHSSPAPQLPAAPLLFLLAPEVASLEAPLDQLQPELAYLAEPAVSPLVVLQHQQEPFLPWHPNLPTALVKRVVEVVVEVAMTMNMFRLNQK